MHKKKGKPISDLLKKKQTEQIQKQQSSSDSFTDLESDEFTESDSSSDSEDYEDYKKDGYHPVFIGENFNNGRYQIIQKLGWGHFSTVWLVLDRKESKHFALKIQKSKPSYQEAAVDEVQMLKHMQNKQNDKQWVEIYKSISFDNKDKDTYCVQMIDNFAHFGIHGKHFCIVFEVLGPSLLDLINHFHKSNSIMPLWLAKLITRQILIGLVYMHNVCGLIHTDLKPENVMLQLKPDQFDQFVEDLKKYDRVPVSMRFLEDMQKSTRNANKNKKQKSKKDEIKKEENKVDENKVDENKNEENTQIKQVQDQQQKIETQNNSKLDIQQQIESKTDITNDFQTQEKVVIEQPYQFEKQETSLKGQEQCEQIQTEISTKQETEDLQVEQVKEGEQIIEQQQFEQSAQQEYKKQQEQQGQQGKQEQQEQQEQQQENIKLKLDTLIWKKHIEIKLDESLQIKIVDLGNACWINKHFTNNIQTREYRSPEAILGIDYDETTDIWSLACLMFELITNDYLFRPEKKSHFSRDEDHLALMQEALGKIPKKFALSGTQSREFFNKNGQLINIKDLKFQTIAEILIDQYQFQKDIAQQIEEFLKPMLEFDPKKRISALKALQNPWLWN